MEIYDGNGVQMIGESGLAELVEDSKTVANNANKY